METTSCKIRLVVSGLLIMAVLTACAPAPTFTPAPTLTPESPAPQPTEMPVSDWVTEFSEPILFAIQDRPPDFQDDFSQPSEWVKAGCGEDQEPCGTIEIADGVMTMNLESGQFSVGAQLWGYENFVMQVDVDLGELDDYKLAEIVLGRGGHFTLRPFMDWELMYLGLQEPIFFSSGTAPVAPSTPVTVTIIYYETESAVFLNGIPITYNKDTPRPRAPIGLGLWAQPPNLKSRSIAYDNLSVWNLDAVFAAPTRTPQPPSDTPQPTASPTPAAWMADFGAPILLAIRDHLPDYQDDFSQGSSGWIESPGAIVDIANGVLALSGGAGQGVDNVFVPRSSFTNFVVQVEVNTQKLIPGCEATIQWRGGADGPGRIFGLQNNKWGLYSIYQSQDDLPFPAGMPTNGPLPLSASGVYFVTLISREPEIAVYLNGEPITYVVDIVRPPDPGFHFGLWYPDFCTAEYDNLKVWDLDKLK